MKSTILLFGITLTSLGALGQNTHTLIGEYWSNANQEWKNNFKSEMQYDSNGYLTSINGYNWGSTWELLTITTYENNENGQALEWVKENNIGPYWTFTEKGVYSYNEEGLLSSFIHEEVVGMANGEPVWANDTKVYYEYDENGFVEWETRQNWYANAWLNTYRYKFNNNQEGNPETKITHNWDEEWQVLSETTYDYDEDDLEILSLSQILSDSEWSPSRKAFSYYTENADLESFLLLSWNSFEDDWVNMKLIEYYYTSDYHQEVEKSWNIDDWKNSKRKTYYYNSTSIDEQKIETPIIYPNPCRDRLTLRNVPTNMDMRITNITGQEVNTQSLNMNTIDISLLPDGYYFIHLSSDDQNYSIPFIKTN